jgi:hypothetical protein
VLNHSQIFLLSATSVGLVLRGLSTVLQGFAEGSLRLSDMEPPRLMGVTGAAWIVLMNRPF